MPSGLPLKREVSFLLVQAETASRLGCMVTCTTPPFRAAVRLNSGVSAINSQEALMRLINLAAVTALLVTPLSAIADSAPDPLFGTDPHAKAVLDCHSSYATRYAKAITGTRATPTEIATAAYAHCIAEMSLFSEASTKSAQENDSTGLLNVDEYVADQTSKLRDYAFAYTLDSYLKQTTNF